MKKIFFLRTAMLVLAMTAATAAPLSADSKISLGPALTSLSQSAISYLATYVADIGTDFLPIGNNGGLYFVPEVTLQGGTADSFSSAVIKLGALLAFFQLDSSDSVDFSKFFHQIPISAGIETTPNFSTISALAEIGYVPQWQNLVNKEFSIPVLKEIAMGSVIGLFVQGGYKSASLSSTTNTGGQVDASSEAPGSGLFRVKGKVKVAPDFSFSSSGFGLVPSGELDVWYDVLHGAFYYQFQAMLRIKFSKDKFFDLTYQKGSGAPDFNQGQQFSTGLTVAF